MKTPSGKIRVDAPGTYRICVQGRLDASWTNMLGGLTVDTSSGPQDGTVTAWSGSVRDQAALGGILSRLFEMGLPLISVERLPDEAPGVAPE
jgi:hypothetical protein